MAKSNGLGDRFLFAGVDLSGDVTALSGMGGGPALLGVTAINASAMERIGGVRDGHMEVASWFNPSTGKQHLTFRGLPTADVHAMYLRGATLGNASLCMIAKQANYAATRGSDGSMSFSVPLEANGFGLEACEQLTAGLKTDTVAANGTAVDLGAVSTLLGLSAYLQATAFTGTSVLIKLQDSADNITFTDITGGAFTAVASVVAERIQTSLSLTVRRYVRAITSTGTFSSVTFAVSFNRFLTAAAF